MFVSCSTAPHRQTNAADNTLDKNNFNTAAGGHVLQNRTVLAGLTCSFGARQRSGDSSVRFFFSLHALIRRRQDFRYLLQSELHFNLLDSTSLPCVAAALYIGRCKFSRKHRNEAVLTGFQLVCSEMTNVDRYNSDCVCNEPTWRRNSFLKTVPQGDKTTILFFVMCCWAGRHFRRHNERQMKIC